MEKPLLFLDTEATGLNNGTKLDEPISIGCCTEQGETVYDTFIKPMVAIDEDAIAIHGITSDALQNAPDFATVLKDLIPLFAEYEVCIYNAAYDVRVLLNAAHNAQVVLPRFAYHCIMQDYATVWCGGKYNVKLTAALEQQGLLEHLQPAHNALADAKMTAALHRHLFANATASHNNANTEWDDEYKVQLVSVAKLYTVKGDAYLRFATVGNQNVNVFANSKQKIVAKGYPYDGWLAKLQDDAIQPLSVPIDCKIKHNAQGFCDLHSVASTYHAMQKQNENGD